MYLIEERANGFTSIPRSIYWAVVTLTTVGYGDISPKTPLGQGLAGLIMILGYSLIVVPTGFVSVAVADAVRQGSAKSCPACGRSAGSAAARFCMHCGRELGAEGTSSLPARGKDA